MFTLETTAMRRAIYTVVILSVSLLAYGADVQPSPCPSQLARLYECVDHVAYYQANQAKGEMDTIMECCKQYDVYTEAKCFWCGSPNCCPPSHSPTPSSPECQTGHDLVAHARTFGLEMLQGFCAGTKVACGPSCPGCTLSYTTSGMDHGPTLIPVASTLPQAGYEAAQQAAEKAAQQAAKLPRPSVVKRGPAKDLTTMFTEQRDVDLTMEFSGVPNINTDDLSSALGA